MKAVDEGRGQSSGHTQEIQRIGSHVTVTVDGKRDHRFYPNRNQDYSGIVFLLSLSSLVGGGCTVGAGV